MDDDLFVILVKVFWYISILCHFCFSSGLGLQPGNVTGIPVKTEADVLKNRQHQTDTFVIAHMITGKALPCKWNLKADCLCTYFQVQVHWTPRTPPFQYAPAWCQLLRKILYFSKRLISTDQPYPTPTDCILIYPTVGQKLLRFFIFFFPQYFFTIFSCVHATL